MFLGFRDLGFVVWTVEKNMVPTRGFKHVKGFARSVTEQMWEFTPKWVENTCSVGGLDCCIARSQRCTQGAVLGTSSRVTPPPPAATRTYALCAPARTPQLLVTLRPWNGLWDRASSGMLIRHCVPFWHQRSSEHV